MEKGEQTSKKTLAQLAAKQKFNEFDKKFRGLVHNYITNNEEFKALKDEFQKYSNIVKALEQTK